MDVWLRRLHDAAKANRVFAGRGLRARSTTQGKFIESISSGASHARFHPFKIYPAKVTSSDDTAKPWRYWSVRGGIVEYRPVTAIPSNTYYQANYNKNPLYGADGVVFGEVNGVWDWFTNDTTPADGVTVEDVAVGNSGDFGVSNSLYAGRFVLNATLDGVNGIGAGFWLEGVDDGSGDFTDWAVKCRMFSHTPGGTGRSANPWPTPSETVIPIGLVVPIDGIDIGGGASLELVVDQFLTSHLINRYPPGIAWDSVAEERIPGGRSCLFFRGYWDSGDSEGLAGTVFYDGDVVKVQQTGDVIAVDGGIGSVTMPDVWQSFVHLGKSLENTAPPGANWDPLSGYV